MYAVADYLALTGKRTWITGTSSGIGAATAKALGKELDALGGVDILVNAVATELPDSIPCEPLKKAEN